MSTKTKVRTKATGEVFTPRSLIREMLEKLPNEVWFDPNKRWLEPAAGDGNFLVEVKSRLMQAGHSEVHILENMLFSIELIDDNHWVLQHRLKYLIDGAPNPALNSEHFVISKISQLTQDLNDKNPYVQIGCARDEVLHHRNHVCASGLEYDMSFGRESDEMLTLPTLSPRDLGAWELTDTPDVGELYVVEKMLGTQPQLSHETPKETKVVKVPKSTSSASDVLSKIEALLIQHWNPAKSPMINRALVPQRIFEGLKVQLKLKAIPSELQSKVKALVNAFSG